MFYAMVVITHRLIPALSLEFVGRVKNRWMGRRGIAGNTYPSFLNNIDPIIVGKED